MDPIDRRRLEKLRDNLAKLIGEPIVPPGFIERMRDEIRAIAAKQKRANQKASGGGTRASSSTKSSGGSAAAPRKPAKTTTVATNPNAQVDNEGRYRTRVTSDGKSLTKAQADAYKEAQKKSPTWHLRGNRVGYVDTGKVPGTSAFDKTVYLYPDRYWLRTGQSKGGGIRKMVDVTPSNDKERPYKALTKAERRAPKPFQWSANQAPNWLELNGAALNLKRYRTEDRGYLRARINSKIGDLKKLGFYDALTDDKGSTFLLDFLMSAQGRDPERFSDKQQRIYRDIDAVLFSWWRDVLNDEQRELFARRYANAAGQERVTIDLREDTHYDYEFENPSGMAKKLKRLGWKLHDYQKAAVNFATKHSAGQVIWAMEMGLGKTLSAIAAYHVLKDQGRVDQMIVTAPRSALNAWRKEMAGTSDARVVIMEAFDRDKRNKVYSRFRNKRIDVMVMTPETLRIDALKVTSAMRNPGRTLRVADEVHFYKNPESARTRAFIDTLGGNQPGPVIGMTGTILPNKAQDFYFTVDAVAPTVLGNDLESFAERYTKYTIRQRKKKNSKELEEVLVIKGFAPGALDRLYQNSAANILTRRISDPDVQIDMPPRLDLSPYVPTDEQQRLVEQVMGPIMVFKRREEKKTKIATSFDLFNALWPRFPSSTKEAVRDLALSDFRAVMNNEDEETALWQAYAEWDSRRAKRELYELGERYKGIARQLITRPAAVISAGGAVTRLRQASISPAVIPGLDEVLGPKYESPKITDVADAVTTHMQNNPSSAVVIFASYRKALERMFLALERRGVPAKRIAVLTSNKKDLPTRMAKQVFKRDVLEDALQVDKTIDYVISITSMLETGANLQGRASFVAYLDTSYIPAQITQSTARVYRQGQKKTVTIYRPTSMNVEEVIEKALQTKLKNSAQATGAMTDADRYLAEAILMKRGELGEEIDIKDPNVLAKLLGVSVAAIKSGRDSQTSLDFEEDDS